MKYILASASPRRKELLKKTGISFEIMPSSKEEVITEELPADIVTELAYQKAADIFDTYSASHEEDFIIIGADTVVSYKDEILGKPTDEQEALDMLSMLADRTHQVYTGVALLVQKDGKKIIRTFYEKTEVTFYPIIREDLLSYIATGDPMDKAGAYGIQGDFAIHVKSINGDYNNVVGLPIGHLYQELKLAL